MHITLKQHELERALEVYLQSLYSKPVTVVGFDLSGMRKSEGVTAMIEIEVEGETSRRVISVNTNTISEPAPEAPESRSKASKKVEEDPIDLDSNATPYANLPTLNKQDQEQYMTILQLLNRNPLNTKGKQIEEAVIGASADLTMVLAANPHYQDWVNLNNKQKAEKALAEAKGIEVKESNKFVEIPTEPVTEPKVEPKTETKIEPVKTQKTLMQEVIEETKDEILDESEAQQDTETLAVPDSVKKEEPTKPVAPTTNLFGEPIQKTKSLFG